MRFCPFCSAENADESAVCASCGRRLPPLPPRRAGSKGQPTGVVLPPRPAHTPAPTITRPPTNTPAPEITPQNTPAPQRTGRTTNPPPIPTRAKGSTTPPPVPDPALANRDSAPSLPPPPAVDDEWGGNDSGALAQLRNAIAPGPAAERRDAPFEARNTSDPSRRKSDSKAPPIPSAGVRSGGSGPNAAPRSTASGASGPNAAPRTVGSGASGPNAAPRSASGAAPKSAGSGAYAPPSRAPGSGSYAPGARATSPNSDSFAGETQIDPFADPSTSTMPIDLLPASEIDLPTTPSQPALADRPKSPSHPPSFNRRAPSQPPVFGDRPKSTSQPPPGDRSKSPSQPPKPQLPAASEYPVQVASTRLRSPTGVEPPPTRIHRPDALVDRPFAPAKVNQVPAIPEPGLVNAARYAYQFAIARWQRRGAIKTLGIEIKQDTEALDHVLGALGRAARGAKVEGRVFSAENTAITAAEDRVAQLQQDTSEVEGRKAEENSKFVDVERERNEKLVEAERMVEEAQRELQHLEAQRRSLRDKRKELERRQKAYLKNADDHDRQAGAAPLGDQRQELRRAAEGHRKEAAALEPDKQDIDRRITALERPINEATARLDAAKAELDAAKRSLNDVREGHTHRLAELDAEQKRKAREIGLAEAEIQRRLVTLGTLVNLNRIEDPQFGELYQRIDRLRGAITARTTEIEKLTAEREAYDRGTLVRGIATIGGAFVALIALIVILKAVL